MARYKSDYFGPAVWPTSPYLHVPEYLLFWGGGRKNGPFCNLSLGRKIKVSVFPFSGAESYKVGPHLEGEIVDDVRGEKQLLFPPVRIARINSYMQQHKA